MYSYKKIGEWKLGRFTCEYI